MRAPGSNRSGKKCGDRHVKTAIALRRVTYRKAGDGHRLAVAKGVMASAD